MTKQGWNCIKCSLNDLNLDLVLRSGQSFRWKKHDGCWFGVHRKRVWQLKQDDTHVWYNVTHPGFTTDAREDSKLGVKIPKTTRKRKNSLIKNTAKCAKLSENDHELDENFNESSILEKLSTNKNLSEELQSNEDILRDYFQLNFCLEKLCQHWAKTDSHFSSICNAFPGVRMLRQNPIENLFSFICSSNNNISRISGMVEKMCTMFGEKICEISSTEYHSFPTVEALARPDTEKILRGLGFGYRAKYIHQTAIKMKELGGEKWLMNLRDLSYDDAHSKLMQLPGIGPKVADCVCMMSLDKTEVIPVDTHVWQIAKRDYKIPLLLTGKRLSATSYRAIGDFFRNLWGCNASWAMNFLFVADLKHIRKRESNIVKIARPKQE